MTEKNGITISKKGLVVILIIAALLVVGGVAVGLNWNSWFGEAKPTDSTNVGDTDKQPDLDEDAVDWQGAQNSEKPQTGDGKPGIAIPGYKSITMKADTKEQSVNLHNPSGNDCYFVMSLLLPDGTEIWRSKMIAPGKGLYQIELAQTVSAGTYENSTLKYECYKMNKDLTPLNGGEVKLILEVE